MSKNFHGNVCACLKADGKRATMPLHQGAVLAANTVNNALLALNSAANFAIYCLVGKKFRRILRRRVFRCSKSTTADDTTAAAVPESVTPTPAALNVDASRGASLAVGGTTGTLLRSTDAVAASDCRKDGACHNGSRVVVVVVSATDAAETARSSPTTPSAD